MAISFYRITLPPRVMNFPCKQFFAFFYPLFFPYCFSGLVPSLCLLNRRVERKKLLEFLITIFYRAKNCITYFRLKIFWLQFSLLIFELLDGAAIFCLSVGLIFFYRCEKLIYHRENWLYHRHFRRHGVWILSKFSFATCLCLCVLAACIHCRRRVGFSDYFLLFFKVKRFQTKKLIEE